MGTSDFLYPKLRGRIIEKFRTYSEFAKAVKEESSVVSRKLNGVIGFTKQDIILWSKMLDIDIKDIGEYFFVELVYQT